jgi:hypothetical protein
MYNQFHSSNDDDLFGETAKQKDKKQIPNPGFFGDEEFEKLLAESQESPSFSEIRVKSRIVNSITSSSAEFINSLESGHRSVFDALNQLTNGDFAKRIYADALEDAIVRRMVVLHFLNDLDELKENHLLMEASKKLNLNIDSHFFKIHISSLAEMISFSIEYNVSIYVTLCEQIGRTPIQSIVERSPQIADHAVMNYNHYILKHFEAIRLELGLDS